MLHGQHHGIARNQSTTTDLYRLDIIHRNAMPLTFLGNDEGLIVAIE
jgi:hypothetical protein